MNLTYTNLYLFLSILLFTFSCNSDFENYPSEEEMDKQSRMDLAMEHEFNMTVDPALGKIPRERLLAAKNELLRNGNQNERSAIPGINWTERGPNNVSGRTRDILIDAADPTGNTIYAGSVGGGLWKCENALMANPVWHSVDDFFENLAVCAIAQDPNDNDILYFGTGEGYFNGDAIQGIGLWKSTDGGDTWDYLNSTANSTFNYSQKIIINDEGTVFVATRSGGVQQSIDGGDSWTQSLGTSSTVSTNSNRAADLEIASNGDLYAAMGIFTQDGIYKSVNNGLSWTMLSNGLPGSDYERIELACAPSDSNVVYALLQDASDNSCKGIYKTTNGGTSWVQKDNPAAFGMDNFARRQAWYDLIAAVDPNDADRIFIGGVDILSSSDGGDNWTQQTQWYGASGYDNVHADQHTIKFLPGSSSTAYFGNDGGVFLSVNAQTANPTFYFISNGYNVTQFYSCAIHPDAEEDYFLAGAQDNGTQQFTDPGINNTFEVTGGDGAFCHIDQDNAQIQITTYVYNYYRVSLNGGNNFSSRNFSDEGRFINPFDYDDSANKLYGAYYGGSYLRWNNPSTGGSNHDIVSVSAFNGSMISHVVVSPNVENRIYFGLGNGDIVMVDEADTGTSKTGTVLRNGVGYLSCIAIEEGNEDHILITYSNYGLTSVFETINGGDSWSSVEGNLPDIPVRWILFNPNNNDEALVATELGVWSTSDLDGNSTEWAPSNTGLANVRVDMLKTRSSDNLVIAATHGRGLFSTERFSELLVGFDKQSTRINEFSNLGAEGDCELHYQELEIPVNVNRIPSSGEDITVHLSIIDTSSATLNEDFVLLTDSLVFSSLDTQLVKYVQVQILDDAVEENPSESFILKSVVDGSVEVGDTLHTVEIIDNDQSPLDIIPNFNGQIGSGTEELNTDTPFNGYWEDAKSQFLYLASDLIDAGFTADSITELYLEISSLGSTQSYTDFSISMKNTTTNTLDDDDFETGMTSVFSEDYSTTLGWNLMELSTPFKWDGTSNLLIQTCFNNTSWTNNDIVLGTSTAYTSSRIRYRDDDNGCDLDIAFNNLNGRPNIRMTQLKDISISDNLDRKTSYIQENELTHFYDDEGHIMLSVKNLEGGDIGCLDVQIDNYGIAQIFPNWLDGKAHSEKTFTISADDDAPYEVTLYFTTDELAAWVDPNALSILKTTGSIMAHSGNNFEVADPAEVTIETFGLSNSLYAYTTTFNTFSGFALTNAEPLALPLNLLSLNAKHIDDANAISWQTTNEVNIDYIELQRSFDGRNFSSLYQVSGYNNASVINDYEYLDEDLIKDNTNYYYRLKVVDFDDSYEYSGIVSVFVDASKGGSLVYPNPFENIINIEPVNDWSLETISLNAASGKQLANFLWDGNSINLKAYPPGVYWLRLSYKNGQEEIHRIVKTR